MYRFFKRQRKAIEEWATRPEVRVSRTARAARYLAELCRHGFRELRHDKADEMAAALTYHTLFSLLPTLVIMLVVMAAFVGPDEREKVKELILDNILAPITVEESPAAPPSDADVVGSTPTAPAPVADEALRPDTTNPQAISANEKKQEFEEARAEIKRKLEDQLKELEGVSFKSIGAVGLLIFIYGATALLATVEKSFNKVYNVSKSRPWYVRIPLYYTVITLGPLVLIAGQWAQAQFMSLIAAAEWTKWFAGPLALLTPLFTTWLVFTLMYALLPNTRVKFRPAMAGGLIAAVVWGLAVAGMKYYVANASTSGVYGALFLLPLFLLWLWVTWLIVLFGLEVAYAIQAMKGRQFKHIENNARKQLVITPTMLLPVMARACAAFDQGKSMTVDKLADDTGFNDDTIEEMVEALHREGLLHRVDDSDPAAYALAKPPRNITAADVLAVGESMLPDRAESNGDPAWKLVDKIRHSDRQLADETTLADLSSYTPTPSANV